MCRGGHQTDTLRSPLRCQSRCWDRRRRAPSPVASDCAARTAGLWSATAGRVHGSGDELSRYLTSRKPFPAYSARYVPSRALPLSCVVTSPRAVLRTNRTTVLLELSEFIPDPEFSNIGGATPVTAFAKAAASSTMSSSYSPSSCLRANQLERKREGGQGNPSPAPAPFFEFSRNSAVAALLSAGASGDGSGAADGWGFSS